MTSDGGPAFPGPFMWQSGTNPECGMSLRDFFAGAALISMLNAPQDIQTGTYARAAMLSYRFADAMLAERAKGGGP